MVSVKEMQVLDAATPATTGGVVASAASNSADEVAKKPYPRLFNQIVLTLENSLIPEHKLDSTPSHIDGLDPETEKDLRILGCELIQTAGILLKLPQVAMATGQVLFQRFFYSKSFVRYNMETVAMSCICLASKIEEAPRRIRDVINVFHHIKQVRAQKDIAPMIVDQGYTNLKSQVIKAERRVLKELGFCVHVKHPHKLIVMYLQVLKYEKHQQLMQMSWNFMNDSLRTDVFMRYQPETIACACIYLSARKLGIALPGEPPWFGLFRVTEDDIVDICYRVMELYTRPKPNAEQLEAAVDELKKRYNESRNKTKEANTPPAVTTVDRNNGSHNAWGGFIQRAVPLPLPAVEKTPERKERKDSRSHSRSRSRGGSRGGGGGGGSRSRSASVDGGDGGGGGAAGGGGNAADYKSRSKKSHRDRSRSRSPRSRSPLPPPPKSKKKSSRHYYTRSPSSSPTTHANKHHRKRKSSRERDYYSGGGGGGGGNSSKDHRSSGSGRDKYQETRPQPHRSASSKHQHHGSGGGGGGGGGSGGGYPHHRGSHGSRGGHKHRERERR